MFDIDLGHYTEVVEKALALRPEIEAAVDKICEDGYSNIFFIGCGGTYAHSLAMMYWLDSTSSKVDAYHLVQSKFPDFSFASADECFGSFQAQHSRCIRQSSHQSE